MLKCIKQIGVVLLVIYIVFCAGCLNIQATNTDKYSHYDIHVKIIPEKHYISVKGSLKYVINEDSLQRLDFGLHKNLIINSFSVNGDRNYEIDTSHTVRWIPDAIKIVFPMVRKYSRGDVLDVEFSYQGKIDEWPEWSANVITSDWVEMGLYFPWYPSIYGDFNYKLTVDIDPEYNVFARGRYSKENDSIIFETETPVYDFVICAAKDLSIHKTQILDKTLQFVNTTLSDTVAKLVQEDIMNCYKFCSVNYGEVDIQNFNILVSKRKKGGGYARKGALFLGGISDSVYVSKRIDLLRYFAHEISHFWWNGAPNNWEDWLNESFAEYTALLLIREKYGEEEFYTRLDKKRKESLNTPPIWGLSRSDSQATPVLYSKAVILLYELEQKIGIEKFAELCKHRIRKNVNNTNDFLELISHIGGKKNANWFKESLKTR